LAWQIIVNKKSGSMTMRSFKYLSDTTQLSECRLCGNQISQYQAISSQQIDQWQKVLVTLIHGQPMPAHHLPQAIENPAQFHANRQSPIDHRPLSRFFVPICFAERPARMGNSNSIGKLSMTLSKLGSANNWSARPSCRRSCR
jgi:hypothetical protein